MGLTSLVHKVSPSVLSTSASPVAPATSSDPAFASKSYDADIPSPGAEARSGLFQRIFSSSSRKSSQRTSSRTPSRKASQRSSTRRDNSLDHAINASACSGSLHNSPRNPLSNMPSSSMENRGVFHRIFSTSAKESEPVGHRQSNPRFSLVPPHYTPAFRSREFPLAPYGRGEWGRDLVVLLGNGLRAELRDMYAMFADLEKRPTMLTMDDVQLFVDWFATFLNAMGELFELEETCLFPWVEGVDTLSHERRMWETERGRVTGELSEARRLRRKGHLMRLGKEIEHCADLFERRPVAEGLPALAHAVDKFVTQLMEYVEARERDLPPIIYRHLRLSDRPRLERTYWGTARSLQYHDFSIIIATRWMDRKQLRRWKRRVLGMFSQGNYGEWKKKFYLEHYSVVKEFAYRVYISEAERMAQVQENDIARARVQNLQGEALNEYYSDSEAHSVVSSSCASSAQRSRNLSAALHAAPACVV